MMRTFALCAAALISAGLISVTAVTTTLASQQQADECASGLSSESKVIYDDVAPQVTDDTNLRDVVTDATKSLVMSGKVARSSAKTSAEAAGECLLKLKS